MDKLRNNPLQAEIRSPNDTRLDFIIDFGKMTLNMVDSQGNCKHNYPKILLLPYIILTMKLLVYVNTFKLQVYDLANFQLIH